MAELVATHKFGIVLSGGILSHAYYLLTKGGAQVEGMDLFGVEEDHTDYNKIVRDRIPEIIAKRGEHSELISLPGEALIMALEEAFEARREVWG